MHLVEGAGLAAGLLDAPPGFTGACVEGPGLAVAETEVDLLAVAGGGTAADPGQLLPPPEGAIFGVQAVQQVDSDRQNDLLAVDRGRCQVRHHRRAQIGVPQGFTCAGVQRVDVVVGRGIEDPVPLGDHGRIVVNGADVGPPDGCDAAAVAMHRPDMSGRGGADHQLLGGDERGRGGPAKRERPVRDESFQLEVEGGAPQVPAYGPGSAGSGDPDERTILPCRNIGQVENACPRGPVGSQQLVVVDVATCQLRPHHGSLDLLRLGIGPQVHLDLQPRRRDPGLGPQGPEPIAVGRRQVDSRKCMATRLGAGLGGVRDVDPFHLEHVAVGGCPPDQLVVAGGVAVRDAGELGQTVDHVGALAVDMSAQVRMGAGVGEDIKHLVAVADLVRRQGERMVADRQDGPAGGLRQIRTQPGDLLVVVVGDALPRDGVVVEDDVDVIEVDRVLPWSDLGLVGLVRVVGPGGVVVARDMVDPVTERRREHFHPGAQCEGGAVIGEVSAVEDQIRIELDKSIGACLGTGDLHLVLGVDVDIGDVGDDLPPARGSGRLRRQCEQTWGDRSQGERCQCEELSAIEGDGLVGHGGAFPISVGRTAPRWTRPVRRISRSEGPSTRLGRAAAAAGRARRSRGRSRRPG